MIDMFLGPIVIASTIRLSAPILFAALGGSFGHKAKVLNIGLESFVLVSAFFAMVGSYLFESAIMGVVFGMVSGMIASIIFAVFVVYFKSNPVVIGISFNLAAWGISTFLLDVIFKVRGVFIDPRIKSFSSISFPIIKDIPYIGRILSNHNILVYLSFILVVVSYIVMYKTQFGLRLRCVGLKSLAAQTIGINVVRYQWIAIVISGILSGLSGAFLVVGGASLFTENMSAGKGFLALAAIMIGNGNPLKVMVASLVFGYTSALSVTLQGVGIPSQIVLMVPYLATILILFVSSLLNKRRLSLIDNT